MYSPACSLAVYNGSGFIFQVFMRRQGFTSINIRHELSLDASSKCSMCHLCCRTEEKQSGFAVLFYYTRIEKWAIVRSKETPRERAITYVRVCARWLSSVGGRWGVSWLSPLKCICIWNSKVRTHVFLPGRVPEVGSEISPVIFHLSNT